MAAVKSLFLVLLIANLTAGAWLLLQAPVGLVREPGRMDLQIDQGRVRILGEAEVARTRQKAASDAAQIAAAELAAGTAPGPAGAPAADSAPASGTVGAAPVEVPLASCIDIGPFASETATRKFRARLASAGLAEHVAASTVDKLTRLRITGVDDAGEAKVQLILRDFAKQELNHCSEAPAAR